MSDLATRTALPIVRATSQRLGVELPAALLKDLEATTKLRDSRHAFFNGPSLTHAVAAAIVAGKDPLADKAVQRAALARQLTEDNIGNRLGSHADELDHGFLREHADAIIDTWRPVVERADKAVNAFRQLVPGASIHDESLPTGLPTRALTPWGEAKEAADLIQQLGKGWHSLAGACMVSIPHGMRPLIVADLSLEQLEALGSNPRIDEAVGAADQLELADMGTFRQRLARVGGDRQSRQDYDASAPERLREERRNLMGIQRIPGGMVRIP